MLIGKQSWYNRTWPRKAAAVTKVAEESITAASDAASSIARAASQSRTKSPTKPARAPSIQLTRSHAGSTRALPANATTTMVHATSDPSLPKADSKQTSDLKADSVQTTGNEPSKTETSARNQQVAGGVGAQEESQVPVSKPAKEKLGKDEASKADATRPETANSKWLGWFASSGTAGKANSSITDASKVEDKSVVKTEVKPDTDGAKIEVPTSSASIPEAKNLSENPATSDPQLAQLSSQKRSWLQMWNSSNGEASAAIPIKGAASPIMKAMANSVGESSSQPGSKAFSLVTSPPPELPGDGNKSAGWIFWSGDRKGGGNTTSDGPRVGELAVSDTPSQKKPKRASIDVEGGREKVKDAIKEPPKPAPVSKGKKQLQAEADSRPQTPAAISKEVSKEITKEEQPTGNQTPTSIKSGKGADLHQASKQLQNSVPTILLPSFKDTFSLQENPSLWQQLARMLNYTKTPEPRHVYKTQDPPRIKSAIAIGVHGYFPAPFIRTVLGQPTGTSIKFADMASKAIRKWTNARGYDCEVKSAALEGEGKIAERVDILWKLLLNWIEEIRKADFILVGCHSQGVPVAIQLVAKLISFGCVNSARIGICAMAGVNLGPFSDYKSRWLSGSASELFDFGDPDSKISKEYLAALETALKFGARVSYIGSIDDQLVSMEVMLLCCSLNGQHANSVTVLYVLSGLTSSYLQSSLRRWSCPRPKLVRLYVLSRELADITSV